MRPGRHAIQTPEAVRIADADPPPLKESSRTLAQPSGMVWFTARCFSVFGVDERLRRVSASDREQAVAALRDGPLDGRLTLDEFSERVGPRGARVGAELARVREGLPELASRDKSAENAAKRCSLRSSRASRPSPAAPTHAGDQCVSRSRPGLARSGDRVRKPMKRRPRWSRSPRDQPRRPRSAAFQGLRRNGGYSSVTRVNGVADDSVCPAEHADHEVEEAAWVAAGEEDREPCDDHHDDGGEPEEDEHDVVRDREQPLDERKPAVQVLLGVRVREVERDRLLLVGGRVAVVHQGEVDGRPGSRT